MQLTAECAVASASARCEPVPALRMGLLVVVRLRGTQTAAPPATQGSARMGLCLALALLAVAIRARAAAKAVQVRALLCKDGPL